MLTLASSAVSLKMETGCQVQLAIMNNAVSLTTKGKQCSAPVLSQNMMGANLKIRCLHRNAQALIKMPGDKSPKNIPCSKMQQDKAVPEPVAQSFGGSECGSEGMGFNPHSGQIKVRLFSLSILTDKMVLVVQSCRVPTPPSTGLLVSV
jgi:hypothetical protein